MNSEAAGEKILLRRQFRAELESVDAGQLTEASARATALAREQPVWRSATGVLAYAASGRELDLTGLIRDALSSGKVVAYPRWTPELGCYAPARIACLETDLEPGRFGILEPRGACPPCLWKQLDLTLAPGLGFALDGVRLGRGKGYYDRLLSGFAGTVCGVGLDEQVVETLPAEPHDRRLNYLLTPTRWIECKPRPVL